MPKYSYRCSGCGEEFDIHHSMFGGIDECILCGDTSIEKIPCLSFSVSRPNKSGQVVKQFIKDANEEVKAQKQKLKEDYNE